MSLPLETRVCGFFWDKTTLRSIALALQNGFRTGLTPLFLSKYYLRSGNIVSNSTSAMNWSSPPVVWELVSRCWHLLHSWHTSGRKLSSAQVDNNDSVSCFKPLSSSFMFVRKWHWYVYVNSCFNAFSWTLV